MYFTSAARKFWHCTRGVTAIEFAIVAPVFIYLMMAAIEYSLILFTQSTLQSSLGVAARQARTLAYQQCPTYNKDTSYNKYTQNGADCTQASTSYSTGQTTTSTLPGTACPPNGYDTFNGNVKDGSGNPPSSPTDYLTATGISSPDTQYMIQYVQNTTQLLASGILFNPENLSFSVPTYDPTGNGSINIQLFTVTYHWTPLTPFIGSFFGSSGIVLSSSVMLTDEMNADVRGSVVNLTNSLGGVSGNTFTPNLFGCPSE